MDFSTLPTLSKEKVAEALAVDFGTLDNDGLAASLAERQTEAKRMFALTEVSPAEADVAEALVASIRDHEAEQTRRADIAKDAADRFAAARDSFSVNDGVESSEDDDAEDEADAEDDSADEDAEDPEADADAEAEADADAEGEGDATVTASGTDHARSQRVKTSAARKVGRKTKRPAVAAKSPTTITAAADIPGIPAASVLSDMEAVTKALMSRVKGFAPFNLQAAKSVASQSGGEPVIHKFGVASFGMGTPEALVSSGAQADYGTVQRAINARYDTSGNPEGDPSLTAAAWCAPSETVYSYIADYVVDGLSPTPEISAPRGGVNITTGPVRSSQGTALDDFGWTQTEAQAEAGTVKPFEVIDCPDFVDHRLDAVGYAYKIPILTQKAYPELVTDALRFANVLYAHRVNRRVLSDKVALSTTRTFNGYGASFTDSLEAIAILATAERRKWNLGENAIIEVEAPIIAREVYRADMSRRTGLALNDVATDQKIAAEFAARHINVTYVADWQEVVIPDGAGKILLPDAFNVLVYPKGTFVRANEDVVNLSAIYDAASLSVNEYTGVFFEQGYLLLQAGYRSTLVTVPINTAGETGAAVMTGLGDSHADGSF